MNEKIELLKNKKGIIAALDQSSGSSERALSTYGIDSSRYKNEKEQFELMHKMRERVITNKSFNKDKIIGTILFKDEIKRKIKGKNTPEYLWENKKILSFSKIDIGLKEKKDGVQTMLEIPNLENTLQEFKKNQIIGTKMRSVIYENNSISIKKLVSEQFELAKKIWKNGLIPIIEPEVNIYSEEKRECELTLKKELDKNIENLDKDMKIILKLSIPEIDNLYEEYTKDKRIIRVVALSGGYDRDYACKKLSNNKGLIASFSKALLQDLREDDSDEEFTNKLNKAINQIYNSSI